MSKVKITTIFQLLKMFGNYISRHSESLQNLEGYGVTG